MLPSTVLTALSLAALSHLGVYPDIIPAEPPDDGSNVIRAAEASVCTMLTVGNELDRVLSGDHDCGPTMTLEEAVVMLAFAPSGPGIRPLAVHVRIETSAGPFEGWLEASPGAQGLFVYLSGLGMYGDGPLAEDFSHAASQQGLASLRVERAADAIPYVIDPVMEAARAVEAADLISRALALPPTRIYGGGSMGGWEALEAARRDPGASAVVLDPVLAPMAVAEHMERPGANPVAQVMAQFFRRMAVERHGESPDVSLVDLLGRASEGSTDLVEDAPERWLCALPPEERARFGVHLSSEDLALGDENRAGVLECGFPVTIKAQAGHMPLACDLEGPARMIEEGLERVPGSDLADHER